MSKEILTAEHAAELAAKIQAAGPHETASQRSARKERNDARASSDLEPEPAIPPVAWGLASYAEGAVKKAVARWTAANPQLEREDLLQAARLGAAMAALTFDPRKGPFVAYAKHDIWGSIRDQAGEMHGHVSIPTDLVSATPRGSEAQKAAAGAWSKTVSFDHDDGENAPLRDRLAASPSSLSIEERLYIRAAVRSLSAMYQQVLALVIDADLTSAEAAKVLCISEQAVRARRKRALAALGIILKDFLS